MSEEVNVNSGNIKKIELLERFQEDYSMREAFKSLRTNVLFCGDTNKVIMLTSCLPNDGKTSVSVELAKSLAELGKKVLFIDADLRKSVMLARYTNTSGVRGLSQILSGQANLQECTYGTQYPGLYMIFSGAFPPNPVELLSNSKFKSLIDLTRKIFDYVIIDCPPLGSVIDAAVIAKNCDGALMVVRSNGVSAKIAQDVKSQLEKSSCHILGVILNFVQRKNTGYYAKYGYGEHGYGKQ